MDYNFGKTLLAVLLISWVLISIYLIPKDVSELNAFSKDELEDRLSRFDNLADAKVHENIEKDFQNERRAVLYNLQRSIVLTVLCISGLLLILYDTFR